MSKFLLWPWSFPSHFSGLSLGRAWPFGGGHNSAPRGTSVGLQMLSGAPGFPAGKTTDPIMQKTPSKRTLMMFHWCWGRCSPAPHPKKPGPSNISWRWDMEAGVKTRTLEESSPASSWMPGRKSSFPAANLMQRQILLPSISRNHNFIFIFNFFFPFGEVHICFTFITSLHYVLLCAAEHEPRTSCREIQSEQLLLFQHVSHSCFSSVISLFFFSSFLLLSFSD